ncbi:MAG: hypothetical protein U0R69_06650 [Gaiellales bacterium]
MATKKQRRRREKLQRHEYEYVVETEEGKEVVVTPPRAEKATGTGTGPKPGQIVDARGRVINPPSWRRALKRGAIFGPIMFVFILFIGGTSVSLPAKIVNALVLIAIFIPFTYLMDKVIYRQVLKRQARASTSTRR